MWLGTSPERLRGVRIVLPFGWLLGCAMTSKSFLAESALLVSVLLLC